MKIEVNKDVKIIAAELGFNSVQELADHLFALAKKARKCGKVRGYSDSGTIDLSFRKFKTPETQTQKLKWQLRRGQ
jgi:hypothetical protein